MFLPGFDDKCKPDSTSVALNAVWINPMRACYGTRLLPYTAGEHWVHCSIQSGTPASSNGSGDGGNKGNKVRA